MKGVCVLISTHNTKQYGVRKPARRHIGMAAAFIFALVIASVGVFAFTGSENRNNNNYIDYTPFGENGAAPPFTITFIFNDGVTPNLVLQTNSSGSICCCDGWPLADFDATHSNGSHFWGWTHTPSLSDSNPWVWSGFTFEGDTYVYAQWHRTVYFYMDGWDMPVEILDGHSFASMDAYYYDGFYKPEAPFIHDYRFMGWYTQNPDGSFNELFTINTVVTENIWVFPRYEALDGVAVIFDPGDGTPHGQMEIRFVGQDGTLGANMPSNPTKPGFEFVAWYYCCCMIIVDGDYVVHDWQSPLTVHAMWGVTVTFNCDYTTLPGGTDYYGFDPRVVVAFRWGQPFIEWPYAIPTRTGYLFRGWYTRTSDGQLDERTYSWSLFTQDTALFARWEEARQVIFNPNGGTTPYGHGVRQMWDDGSVDMPDHPHRGGHRFMGWTRTQDGLGSPTIADYQVYFWGTVEYDEESPLTLYAQWGFPVNFLCMHPDRSGDDPPFWEPDSIIVHAGGSAMDTADLPWVGWINWPTPTNQHRPAPQWRFIGWFTNLDVNNPGTQVTPQCNITSATYLFAHWELRPIHTVTFDLSGGFLGTHPGASPPGTQTLTRQAWEGDSVSWSSLPESAAGSGGGGLNSYVAWRYSAPQVLRNLDDGRAIHVESWWTQPGGEAGGGQWWSFAGHDSILTFSGGRLPFQRATTPVIDDITVYADWVFRVTFHPNAGTAGLIGPGLWSPGTPGFTGLGVSYHVRHIPVGPNFEGGTINNDGFLRTAFDQHVWCPDTQQILSTPAGTKVPLGMPRAGIMTRLNHVFLGWWSVPMTNVAPGDEPPGAFQFTGNEVIDRDTRMYARWDFVPFDQVTVTFDVNGGQWWSGDPYSSRTTVPFQQGTQLSFGRLPQFPQKEGYIFMGWYRPALPAGTTAPIQNRIHSHTVINESITVFAHWERYHIVTFNPNGGTHPQGIPYRKVAHNRTFGEMSMIWTSTGMQTSGNGTPPSMNWHGQMYVINGRYITGSPSPRWFDNGDETLFLFFHPWNAEPDASGQVLSHSVRITESRTFYAQWVVRVTFRSNLESFIVGGGCVSRFSYTPAGYSFRAAQQHPHASYLYASSWGDAYLGHFPTSSTWPILSNPMAAHIGFNMIADGSGAAFSIDTIVTEPIDVFGMWTTNVRFVENGAPLGTILPHNRERVVAIGDPLYTGVCPFTPFPYVTGMPPNPYWPGFRFSHWSEDPLDPRAFVFKEDGSDEIHRPTAIYAIWRAIVLYDATGGTSRTLDVPTDEPVQEASTFRGEPIAIDSRAFAMARSGWAFVEWNTARFGLRDGDGVLFNPALPVIYSKRVYAQWRANITFNLQGGHVGGSSTSVVRQVLEGDTIQNNGGIPTPARPGYTFTGWSYANGNPIPSNFGTMPWEDGHTTVFAGWEPITSYFEFIKSTYVIYDGDPADPLPGAVFRLYRLVTQGDGGLIPDVWAQVGTDVTSRDVPTYGLVRFEGLTLTGTYRLEEISAPRGFHTPDGHWIIRWNRVDPMDHTTWIPQAAEYGEAPEFLRRQIAGAQPVVYRLYVGNMPAMEEDFIFRKTDNRLHSHIAPSGAWDMTDGILLGGAIFELFRFNGAAPPSGALVSPGNIGTNPGQWQRVGLPVTSSSNPADPALMFSLTVDGIYHLVEKAAPQGFMTPFGQWRIWVDEDEVGGFAIQNIGCTMLPIILWNNEDTFYIANIPDFELPLSGGLGRGLHYAAGFAMVFAAAGVWVVLRSRRGQTNAVL